MDPTSANPRVRLRLPVVSLPLGIISIIVDDPIPSLRRRRHGRTAKKRLFPFRWVPDVASLGELAGFGLDPTVPASASTRR